VTSRYNFIHCLYVCHLIEISEVILIVGDSETIVWRMITFAFIRYEQLTIERVLI